MTLTINLPIELEQYLLQEANQKGLAVEALAVQLLASSISSQQKSKEVVDLLQSWIDEDDGGEQEKTGRFLVQALDEDRLSDRKLFPPELKGISW